MPFSKKHQVTFFLLLHQVTLKKKALQALEHSRHPGGTQQGEGGERELGSFFHWNQTWGSGGRGQRSHFMGEFKTERQEFKAQGREKSKEPKWSDTKSRCIPGCLPGSGGPWDQSIVKRKANGQGAPCRSSVFVVLLVQTSPQCAGRTRDSVILVGDNGTQVCVCVCLQISMMLTGGNGLARNVLESIPPLGST